MEHTAEQEHESHFIKVFVAVLIALILFTFFCIFMARALAPPVDNSQDEILRAALLERIAPVGAVNTSADQVDAPAGGGAGSEVAEQTPQQVVDGACAACHATGVADAPKTDDTAEWAKRREAGLETLVASVINGKGAMPARAGTNLSDEQLQQAVELIAGFTVTPGAAHNTSTATAEASTTEASAPAESAESAAAESSTNTASAASTSADTAPAISDDAKAVADSVCMGCHLAGVAGAPKIGDKDAWAQRAEKGMAEMVKLVVTGMGAMPPMGGSTLSEEDLAGAIQHLMNK